MSAKKTEKAIKRATKTAVGVNKIVEQFQHQVNVQRRASAHSHASSAKDEVIIQADLRKLRPFQQVNGRQLESFPDISFNPTASLDRKKFHAWMERHRKKIAVHFPTVGDTDNDVDNLPM